MMIIRGNKIPKPVPREKGKKLAMEANKAKKKNVTKFTDHSTKARCVLYLSIRGFAAFKFLIDLSIFTLIPSFEHFIVIVSCRFSLFN
jgi:hypothetical protein